MADMGREGQCQGSSEIAPPARCACRAPQAPQAQRRVAQQQRACQAPRVAGPTSEPAGALGPPRAGDPCACT